MKRSGARWGISLSFLLALSWLLTAGAWGQGPLSTLPLQYDFFPPRGERRVLVLPAWTPDLPPAFSSEEIHHRLFSRSDDEITSLAEYYDEVSYGALRLEGEVTDWIELSRPMSEYAGNSYGLNARRRDGNLGVMARETVEAALAAGVDFSRFDNNGDGHVDGLIIIYSGPVNVQPGVKSPDRFWPRVEYISMLGLDPINAGGAIVDRFAIIPEFLASPDRPLSRVYAHEFGHLLGLPDYYDKDNSSFGAGALDLMSVALPGQRDRPAIGLSAYSRELLGWIAPRVIEASTVVRLNPIATHPEALRINTRVPGEYFLVSYRTRRGLDKLLFGEGLLVWQVNERAIFENRAECRKVPCSPRPNLALVQADGRKDLEHRRRLADPFDFFPGPEGKFTELGADTGREDDPFQGATTLTFSGLPTGIRITGIKTDHDQAELRIIMDDPAMPCRKKPCFRILRAQWEELEGNGDGFADPGETMKLKLTMINLGKEARGVMVSGFGSEARWQKRRQWLSRVGPGQEFEIGFQLKIKAGSENKPAWFKPEIELEALLHSVSAVFSPRLIIGTPRILVVNDAPHDLIPHLTPALESLGEPYLALDVIEEGLPELSKIRSAPLVIWLCGTRPLAGDYPDPERLRLMRAVVENGNALVLNASNLRGPPPRELLDLFGVSEAVPAAGTRRAVGVRGHPLGERLSLRLRYAYYPALTPHLNLEPAPGGQKIFSNLQGRTAALARFQDHAETEKISTLFIAFPLESLATRQLSNLLKRLLDHSR